MTVYYHRTDHAEAILHEGFRDTSGGTYGISSTWLTGVWISSEPLDVNDGASGELLLAVELSADVAGFEIINAGGAGGAPREWCVPSEILNTGKVRLLDQEEEDQITLQILAERGLGDPRLG